VLVWDYPVASRSIPTSVFGTRLVPKNLQRNVRLAAHKRTLCMPAARPAICRKRGALRLAAELRELHRPSRHQMMPKLRAFIDHVRGRLDAAGKSRIYANDKAN
jgi:hypothetical protein